MRLAWQASNRQHRKPFFKVDVMDTLSLSILVLFVGLGLGATPVALANVDVIINRYGPSPQALLIIPLVGAFFLIF